MGRGDDEMFINCVVFPLIVGIVLLPIAGMVYYKPTHDEQMAQISIPEHIMAHELRYYNCPSTIRNNHEYTGSTSCWTVLENLESYRIGQNIQCGNGPGCQTAYNPECAFTYAVHTNNNTGISAKIVGTIGGQFYGITGLSACNPSSPISVNGIILDYKCTYTGSPNGLTNNYLYTSTGYDDTVYIYIKSVPDVACNKTCSRNFTNQQSVITVGKCASASYKAGFTFESVTTAMHHKEYICGYNQENCVRNFNASLVNSLQTVYYNKQDGKYSYTEKKFAYASAIAMFVFGSIFIIWAVVISCCCCCE